jgi:hypothetical protein
VVMSVVMSIVRGGIECILKRILKVCLNVFNILINDWKM